MDHPRNQSGYAAADLGAGAELPPLPTSLLEKFLQVRRLLGEISHDLGVPSVGPGGLPGLPPGVELGDLLPSDEIEKIRDALRGRDPFQTGMRIADVEMTQSIQFLNFDQQSSGAAPDNSVPLVANKELVLRVYVEIRPGLTAYVPDRLTGRVRFGGQEFAPWNGPLAPQEGSLIRRANWDDTLNFRIPAALCRGNQSFQVRVFDADDPPLKRYSSTTRPFIATFREVPPLRVIGVLVNYGGPPDFDLPAPTGLNLVESLSRFLPMFPIHGFDFGPCVVTGWGEDLRIQPQQKNSGWDLLLTFITNLRNASTERAFYVGLLPPKLSAVVGSDALGIGRPGVAIAAQNNTRALAHEFGHAALLPHLEVGGAAPPFDTNYPKYRDGTFPFGSIGEFGVDTARLTLFNPSTVFDLMTYADPDDVLFPVSSWISPHNYQRLLNAIVQSHGTGDFPPAPGAGLGKAMLLNFRLSREGQVELLPSYVVTGIRSFDRNRPARPVLLELLGRDGERISSYRCHEHNPYQDPEGSSLDFHEVVPWSDEVAQVVVVRNGQRLHSLEVAAQAPELRLEELRRSEPAGRLARLEWAVGNSGQASPALVRYSPDDGRTWQALAADLTETRFLANLETLPGGERCRLEVIVSSGLRSAVAQTEPFAVPCKPRQAYLISPRKGESFRVGAPIVFLGGGYSPDGGTGAGDEVLWRSSLDAVLGTGYQVVRSDLQPGTHRITLSMPDCQGDEATASVWIKVVAAGQPPVACGSVEEAPTRRWAAGK